MGCLVWPSTEIEIAPPRLWEPLTRPKTRTRRRVLPFSPPRCAIGVNANTSSGDTNAAGATITVTKPTGTASTDILIICFAVGWASGSTPTVAKPTNWTLVGQVLSAGGGSRNISVYCWWSLGSNSNLGFTTTNASGNTFGWLMTGYTGVDNTTPIDATGTANSNTAASSITANAVTVATTNAWEVIAAGDWLGKVAFSATGFTEKHNAAANESAVILYNTTPLGTGSTGTVSVADSDGTSTNQVMAAIPFALRPAAATTIPNRVVNLNQAVTTATY